MTLTVAPTGVFRITPDDGGVYAFEIGRAPDLGDVNDHDLGQTVARSESEVVYVYGKEIETRTYAFQFTGLTTHEFWALFLYLRDTLRGSNEVATIDWGRARNRILYGTTVNQRDSENYANWSLTGSTSVDDGALTGPEGVAGTASEITFGAGAVSTQLMRCLGVLDDFPASTGYVGASFLAKVTDGGGSLVLRSGSNSPGVFDRTIADDGAWHRVSGTYANQSPTSFGIRNGAVLAGSRTFGLAHVQVLWSLDGPPNLSTFFDPAPLQQISNARYIPGTFRGRERQVDVWDCEVTFRSEVA